MNNNLKSGNIVTTSNSMHDWIDERMIASYRTLISDVSHITHGIGKPFGFTIKRTQMDGLGTTQPEIEVIVKHMASSLNVDILDIFYEKDSKDLLHCHGTFMAPKVPHYKKAQKKGWRIFIQQIRNLQAWKAYIRKAQ